MSLPPSAKAVSPPQSSRKDQLKLHMETQELEIKRLQLEMQLAQLKLANHTEKIRKPDKSMNTGDKSLGDQRAPQRITNPQEWPHIFAPGEPKLFNELSMAEFSAGYAIIIQRCTDVSLRAALIPHFHDLMVLASTYIWSAVRAYHYKVLRSIELGLVSWGILSTRLSSLFSCPPVSSRIQLTKHTAALPPNNLRAQLLALHFLAMKFVTPGLGTITAKTMSVASVMSASCASATTKPEPVPNGSILSYHVVKTPPLKID